MANTYSPTELTSTEAALLDTLKTVLKRIEISADSADDCQEHVRTMWRLSPIMAEARAVVMKYDAPLLS